MTKEINQTSQEANQTFNISQITQITTQVEEYLIENQQQINEQQDPEIIKLCTLTEQLMKYQYNLYITSDDPVIRKKGELNTELVKNIRSLLFDYLKSFGTSFVYQVSENKYSLKLNDFLTLNEETIKKIEPYFYTVPETKLYIGHQNLENVRLLKGILKTIVKIPNFAQIVPLLLVSERVAGDYSEYERTKKLLTRKLTKIVEGVELYLKDEMKGM